MNEWADKFRHYSLRPNFHLGLTRPMLEFLFAVCLACAFAMPQATKAPQPKVTNSSGSIQTGYTFVQAVPYANPQTQQAPKLKEYPTLKACQAAEGLSGASNNGPDPNTTTIYDCQKLKDGNWAWFEDKNKTFISFSSTESGVIEYGNSSALAGNPQTTKAPNQPASLHEWSTTLLAGDPQMMVPTMRDKVTHTRELGCEKGYEEDKLVTPDPTTREITDYLDVCVKPSFIAQLRKAEQ